MKALGTILRVLPFAFIFVGCVDASSTDSLLDSRLAATEEEPDEDPGDGGKDGPGKKGKAEAVAGPHVLDAGTGSSSGGSVFTGAPAFKASAPTQPANDHHLTEVTGRACLDCHTSNSDSKSLFGKIFGRDAPNFLFAGTIHRGSQPAAGVEVRLVGTTGAVNGSTFSDADGNFWLKSPSTSAAGRVGVRNAAGESLMRATISMGNCNSSDCHGSSHITVH